MKTVTGYSLEGYGDMVADRVRMNAYAESLRRSITADSIVMDIGAGTGIWSLLSCKYGARHVYAIEPDDSILVARELAKANGFADRITFLQALSTEIELPERADIIVSDLRGTIPFFEQNIDSIIDARERHLNPGGVLIPQQDTVWACPVDTPDTYQKLLEPWGNDVFGLDFSSNRKTAVNVLHNQRVGPENLLAKPRPVATLDYRKVKESNIQANLAWTAERTGHAHGISMWFETRLSDSIGYSTAPGQEPLVYGMALILLTEPVAIAAGDLIELDLLGTLVSGQYVWQWQTEIFDGSDRSLSKSKFRQSTFDGAFLAVEQLRKKASNYVPEISVEGKVDRFVLNLLDGKTSLEEISRRLTAEFPDQYPTLNDALGWVGKISMKYSR